jgi:hypothetical protein
MKKLFLICLMMLAGSAWAEWVKYADTDESSFYFDPATFRKDGNMRRVWLLQDLRKRHKDGEMSRRYRAEYDCKNERWRILTISEHSEPMAGGSAMRSQSDEDSWTDIAPGTVTDTMLKIVCAK